MCYFVTITDVNKDDDDDDYKNKKGQGRINKEFRLARSFSEENV